MVGEPCIRLDIDINLAQVSTKTSPRAPRPSPSSELDDLTNLSRLFTWFVISKLDCSVDNLCRRGLEMSARTSALSSTCSIKGAARFPTSRIGNNHFASGHSRHSHLPINSRSRPRRAHEFLSFNNLLTSSASCPRQLTIMKNDHPRARSSLSVRTSDNRLDNVRTSRFTTGSAAKPKTSCKTPTTNTSLTTIDRPFQCLHPGVTFCCFGFLGDSSAHNADFHASAKKKTTLSLRSSRCSAS